MGDIKSNSKPRTSSALKSYHCNLNGLAAHEFIKLFLLECHINVNEIDIICLSEIFLESPMPIDNNRVNIPGYSMIRAYHPSYLKNGG